MAIPDEPGTWGIVTYILTGPGSTFVKEENMEVHALEKDTVSKANRWGEGSVMV